MLAKAKKIVITELEDLPDDKVDFLLNFIHFLKSEKRHRTLKKVPNKTTEKTFRDTDEGKNLNTYSSLDSFFNKMES
jgi:hypothetical protein